VTADLDIGTYVVVDQDSRARARYAWQQRQAARACARHVGANDLPTVLPALGIDWAEVRRARPLKAARALPWRGQVQRPDSRLPGRDAPLAVVAEPTPPAPPKRRQPRRQRQSSPSTGARTAGPNEFDPTEAARRYQAGERLHELARSLHISDNRLRRALAAQGVPLRTRSDACYRRVVPPVDAEQAKRLYAEGTHVRDIARRMHVANSRVSDVLREAGVLRTPTTKGTP
jgi:hypothetical protein